MGKLSGKIAIVTGGGVVFGASIVAKFVADGAKMLVMDVNEELAKRPIVTLPPGSAVAIYGRVSSNDDWITALDAVIAAFGKVDIVVNNAGVLHKAQPSAEMDKEEYERIMRINVKPLLWSKTVTAPYFTVNRKPGAFVNISSISGTRPRPKLVWYAALKGAVNVVRPRVPLDSDLTFRL